MVNVHEVTGLGPLRTRLQRAVGRGLTKFVGRDREMVTISDAAELAKHGHGQLVAAIAEAGLGKSRLFHEFKAIAQSGWTVLECFSLSHGKASAFMPVIDLLRSYFSISAEDDERKRREKVAGKIAILDRSLEDTLPYLFSLLGIAGETDPLAPMDGEIRKERTLEAIKRILLRATLNQPLLVIFEDLHWFDAESLELLNVLANAVAHARMLMLVNYRPEFSHEWGSKSCYTQLRIDPLTIESAQEMLHALLSTPDARSYSAGQSYCPINEGDDALAAAAELGELKRLIIAKTEGNPFFIEEMVRALFEQGLIAGNATLRPVKPLNEVKVPPTVQEVLASRIDRLPPAAKELLQILSVIGREFPLSLVRIMSGPDEPLTQMLAELQLAEFILERPSVSDVEFTFKHVLTQEVAYNSLLTERRKQIHERAAQAIESLFAATLADHYGNLAHHYGRSGNGLKAAKYLHLEARQAMGRWAYTEARDKLVAALEMLRTQPDELERNRIEIAVRHRLAICMRVATRGGFAASQPLEILERARELCEQLGDDASLLEVLEALAVQYGTRSEHQKARALREELLGIARRTGEPEMIGRAQFWLGHSSMFAGNFTTAMQEFERAHQLAAKPSKQEATFADWRSEGQGLASLTLWCLGYPERAAARSSESFISARESMAQFVAQAWALYWSGVLNVMLRDWRTAYSHADQAIRLAQEHGLVYMLPWTAFLRGWSLAKLGQVSAGLSEMLESRGDMQITGAIIQPWFFWGLADVYLAAGRRPEGLEATAEGLEMVQRTHNGFCDAELRRLKGECLLLEWTQATACESEGDRVEPVPAAKAAGCLREAIEIARHQNARSWELRATISLARLLAKQGSRDEARTILAEIYKWFTEGFDTRDLQDAKALMTEFGS